MCRGNKGFLGSERRARDDRLKQWMIDRTRVGTNEERLKHQFSPEPGAFLLAVVYVYMYVYFTTRPVLN